MAARGATITINVFAKLVQEAISTFVKEANAPPTVASRADTVCKALPKPSDNRIFSRILHPAGRFTALHSELQNCTAGVHALVEPTGYGKTTMMRMLASKVNGLKVFSLRGVKDPVFTSFLKQMKIPTSKPGLNELIFQVVNIIIDEDAHAFLLAIDAYARASSSVSSYGGSAFFGKTASMLAKPVIVVDDIHDYRGEENEMHFFLAQALEVFHQQEQGVIIGTSSEGDTVYRLRTSCMRSHHVLADLLMVEFR